MTKRIALAGLLGGLAMFVWASIAHMATPLASVGISEIPNEAALLNGMQSTLGAAPGMYHFPALGSGDMKQYEAKLATTPSGILIYNPPGSGGFTAGRLIAEFLSELAEAFLLAWLMAQSRLKGTGSRVGFALAVGFAAAITTNISYWNWYGFPGSYTVVYMAIEIVGFLVAGLVAARMLGRELA